MRQSHDAYISRLITNSGDGTSSINPKRFWNFIKKLRKDSNGTQPALKVDDNLITDRKEKAGIFNSHFESVFTNEPDEALPEKGCYIFVVICFMKVYIFCNIIMWLLFCVHVMCIITCLADNATFY